MSGSKLIKIIAGCTLCLFLLTICTYAHSGKTDYAGGHYNNSTGEYHYHHGYSAHSHYDIDGDGVIDCPYEFNDKTNHNNSLNNSSSSNSSNDKTNNNSIISENNTEKSKNKITFGKAIEVIFVMIPCSLMTLYTLYMVFGFICIIIELVSEKFLKVAIEKSIKERILRILLIIGLVMLLPLEILFLLGIL